MVEDLVLRLSVRAPFDGGALLAWLAARAVPGVEEVDGEVYRRSLRLAHGPGVAELTMEDGGVRCRLWLEDRRDVTTAEQLCRRLLDLDADPAAVAEHLGRDPLIGPLVRAAPGLRVPGSVDGAELAVRAVLGQQISVPAARTAAGRLVAEHGEALPRPRGAVTALFPAAPRSPPSIPRACPCRALAPSRSWACAARWPTASCAWTPARTARRPGGGCWRCPGIGPWTAGYVAMRALGDPDVFLAEDLGVRHALRRLGGPDDPRAARALAEAWAPWRSYASQHLWQAPPPCSRSSPLPVVGPDAPGGEPHRLGDALLAVGARLALAIQNRIAWREEGPKASNWRWASGSAASAALRSPGTTRSSAASYVLHDPFALAAAMAAVPAGAISPAATSSLDALLVDVRDHAPRGLRGAKSWM